MEYLDQVVDLVGIYYENVFDAVLEGKRCTGETIIGFFKSNGRFEYRHSRSLSYGTIFWFGYNPIHVEEGVPLDFGVGLLVNKDGMFERSMWQITAP